MCIYIYIYVYVYIYILYTSCNIQIIINTLGPRAPGPRVSRGKTRGATASMSASASSRPDGGPGGAGGAGGGGEADRFGVEEFRMLLRWVRRGEVREDEGGDVGGGG